VRSLNAQGDESKSDDCKKSCASACRVRLLNAQGECDHVVKRKQLRATHDECKDLHESLVLATFVPPCAPT
jgi:hypothetical protein